MDMPALFYGTAWKEDETGRLVELALQQGFRGIDTANQRRHYHEQAVGEAIAVSIANGSIARQELFLQTKFTFRHGQDHRLPYDPNAAIGDVPAETTPHKLSLANELARDPARTVYKEPGKSRTCDSHVLRTGARVSTFLFACIFGTRFHRPPHRAGAARVKPD